MPTTTDSNAYRRRLVVYFKKYDPTRIPMIEAMLKKCEGREEDFIAALVKKYGPEPQLATGKEQQAALAARLQKYYAHYDPAKLTGIDALSAKYAGIESELFAALEKKYGPESAVTAEGANDSEAAAQPQLVAVVETATVTPSAAAAAARCGEGANSETGEGSRLEERLRRFYAVHDPAKLKEVPTLAAKYRKGEADLFAALIKKYGPEPQNAGEEKPSIVNEGKLVTDAGRSASAPAPPAADTPAAPDEKSNADTPGDKDEDDADENDTAEAKEQQVAAPKEAAAPGAPQTPQKTPTPTPTLVAAVAVADDEMANSDAAAPSSAVSAPPPPPPRESIARDDDHDDDGGDGRSAPLLDRGSAAGKVDDSAGASSSPRKQAVPQEGSDAPGANEEAATRDEREPSSLATPAFREHVAQLYAHNCPAQLHKLDMILEAYRGREEELLEELRGLGWALPTDRVPDTSPAAKGAGDASLTDTGNDATHRASDASSAGAVNGPISDEDEGENGNASSAGEGGTSERGDHSLKDEQAPAGSEEQGAAASGSTQPGAAMSIDDYAKDYSARARSKTLMESGAAPPAGSQAHTLERVRLLNFFRHYEPASIRTVDELLANNKGCEDKLLEDLVQIYGPEPLPYMPTDADRAQLRDILNEYYAAQDPMRLPDVERMAQKYAGMEYDLFRALKGKYGVAPRPFDYERSKAAQPVESQQAPAGNGSDVAREEPQQTTANNHQLSRQLLAAYFQKHDAARAEALPDATLMAAEARGEAHVLGLLAHKYGEDLHEFARSKGLPMREGEVGAPPPRRVSAALLRRYFAKHDPARAEVLSAATLDAFEGRNDALFEVLKKKYGECLQAFADAQGMALYDAPSAPSPAASPMSQARQPVQSGGAGSDEAPPASPRQRAKSVVHTNERKRIMDFFRAFDKHRMAEVDEVLANGVARGLDVDDVVRALEREYGAKEPPPFVPSPRDIAELERRIANFYAKYEPEKMKDARKLAIKYCGIEPDLFSALEEKYGPEPCISATPTGGSEKAAQLSPGTLTSAAPGEAADPATVASEEGDGGTGRLARRLGRFFAKYDPSRIAASQAMARQFAGREKTLFADLVATYGPEPLDTLDPDVAAAMEAFSARLRAFYEHHDPTKLANVPLIVSQFAGDADREEQLMRTLVRKYGPEPLSAGAFPAAVHRATENTAPLTEGRVAHAARGAAREGEGPAAQRKREMLRCSVAGARLRKYLLHYEVVQTMPPGTTLDTAVAALLEHVDGDAEAALELLQLRHGPEPMSTSAILSEAEHEQIAQRLTSLMHHHGIPGVAFFVLQSSDLFAYADCLFDELARRFGELPAAPRRYEVRLRRFYKKYAPEKVPFVPHDLAAHAGREEDMFALLTRVYGPEPKVDRSARLRRHVAQLYAHNCPAQLHKLDMILDAYRGRESVLLAELDALGWQRGPAGAGASSDDDGDDGGEGGGTLASNTSWCATFRARRDRRQANRKRIVELLQQPSQPTQPHFHRGKEHVAEADRLLAAYEGRESSLFAELQHQQQQQQQQHQPERVAPKVSNSPTSHLFSGPSLRESASVATRVEGSIPAVAPRDSPPCVAVVVEEEEKVEEDGELTHGNRAGPQVEVGVKAAAQQSAQRLADLQTLEEQTRGALDFAEYEAASALRCRARSERDEVALLEELRRQLNPSGKRGAGPLQVSVAPWYDALAPYFSLAMTTSPAARKGNGVVSGGVE